MVLSLARLRGLLSLFFGGEEMRDDFLLSPIFYCLKYEILKIISYSHPFIQSFPAELIAAGFIPSIQPVLRSLKKQVCNSEKVSESNSKFLSLTIFI
jgi:hypothetical protein